MPAQASPPARQIGETVAEAVRRQILDALLFGDLASPARLYPNDLAARFGVSITPVREALARLAADGFIEAVPRHGFHVRNPSPDHVGELWSVRLALELMAGECILRRFPDPAARAAALASLHAIHAQLGRATQLSHRAHVALNGQFHDTLVKLAGNALLEETYRGIRVRLFVAWVQRGSPAWRGRLAAEQAEHQAIIDALEAGAATALDAAIRRHLARSLGDAITDAAINNTPEETDETARRRGPGSRHGPAAPARGQRAADDDTDVDLPQPRRHQPARGRAR
jgi:DNA-binding GntR family transcriptional regulator